MVGVLPAERVREHAGHPARVSAGGRPAGVRGAARAGGDDFAFVRHLLGLRVVRARSRLVQGSEEYLDSEKYEVKRRALDGPLLPLVQRLNELRRAEPALQRLENLRWLETENDQLIAYAKDDVICIVNIDPFAEQEGACVIPVALGLPPAFDAHDLLSDRAFTWRVGRNYVKLGPGKAHLIKARIEMTDPTGAARGRDDGAGNWFERDPLWFKKAVFYEIHLRGFYDGNDDGSGDFRGLTEKLDYLQWLGVDCLWLLPVLPEPAPRRRLRHRGLLRHPSGLRQRRGLHAPSSTRLTSAGCA